MARRENRGFPHTSGTAITASSEGIPGRGHRDAELGRDPPPAQSLLPEFHRLVPVEDLPRSATVFSLTLRLSYDSPAKLLRP